MLLTRKLSREEFFKLLEEAPETETSFLRDYVYIDYYDFFSKCSKEWQGLVEDDRPVYVAMVDLNNRLWTVANTNIKHPVKMFKECKRNLYTWVEKYGDITATMGRSSPKNVSWTKRLGLKQTSEDEETITLSIGSVTASK